MKNHAIVLICLGLLVSLTSCDKADIIAISPSQKITTVDKDFSGYDKLEVSGEFEVFVNFSNTKESIKIEANENLQDRINVEVKGKTLHINLKNKTNIRGNETLKVYITTETITEYTTSGEVQVQLEDELIADELTINLKGESIFTGTIDVAELNGKFTGESQLNLTGKADKVDVKLTSESEMRDYGFICQEIDMVLTGDSKAYLTVEDKIKVRASGDSVLHYKGDAEVKFQLVTGEGKVIKED